MNKLALLVDDEPDIIDLLDITLSRMNVRCLRADNLAKAKALLKEKAPDLCLTDMRLPDGNGIDLVRHIQSTHPSMPVAMITAHGNVDIAIEAMKAGAFDFLSKPIDLDRLRSLISSALKLGAEAESADSELLVGKTPVMQKLKQQINKLARSQAPILITGESGCGKELVARSIHTQGARSDKPFVAVNCGAIPRELMESEFFGHKRGSFTGANADKEGLFQAADGGTLFLDEVADLPLDMQVKLLRAIQEKAVRAIGSQQEQKIDVRILSATHKNLKKEIEENRFRQDLYYRINVIEVHAPPLRERKQDIPLLISAILDRLAQEYQSDAATLTEDARQLLLNYPFPGNVRELENTLERAFTLCDGQLITVDDLQISNESHKAPAQIDSRAISDLESHLEEVERKLIINALEATRWNRTEAAKKLGISFRSMRYRLRKLGLD